MCCHLSLELLLLITRVQGCRRSGCGGHNLKQVLETQNEIKESVAIEKSIQNDMRKLSTNAALFSKDHNLKKEGLFTLEAYISDHNLKAAQKMCQNVMSPNYRRPIHKSTVALF